MCGKWHRWSRAAVCQTLPGQPSASLQLKQACKIIKCMYIPNLVSNNQSSHSNYGELQLFEIFLIWKHDCIYAIAWSPKAKHRTWLFHYDVIKSTRKVTCPEFGKRSIVTFLKIIITNSKLINFWYLSKKLNVNHTDQTHIHNIIGIRAISMYTTCFWYSNRRKLVFSLHTIS